MNPALLATVMTEGLKLLKVLIDKATPETIETAKSVVSMLSLTHNEAIKPEAVLAELQQWKDHLHADDAAALAELHERFNGG